MNWKLKYKDHNCHPNWEKYWLSKSGCSWIWWGSRKKIQHPFIRFSQGFSVYFEAFEYKIRILNSVCNILKKTSFKHISTFCHRNKEHKILKRNKNMLNLETYASRTSLSILTEKMEPFVPSALRILEKSYITSFVHLLLAIHIIENQWD